MEKYSTLVEKINQKETKSYLKFRPFKEKWNLESQKIFIE